MQKKDEEGQRQDSLPCKPKKQQKTKLIKKKQMVRQITHYFSKVDKQIIINKNIPTPDKQAIQQMDRILYQLQFQQQKLINQIDDIKMKIQRQKNERQYYMNNSRNYISNELKKISQINRFFKRQNILKLKQRQQQLYHMRQQLKNKKIYLQSIDKNIFQYYFISKQIQLLLENINKLQIQINFLSQNSRIAIQQQNCYFSKEKWPLLIKRYQTLQLIGKGGFSQVYKSYDLYNNQIVALKLSSVQHLLQGCGNKHQYLKHIKRQYQIHKLLNHQNIVRLIQVIDLQSAICIVLEYCQGYNLAEYLKIVGKISEIQAKMIIQKIAKVIQYLNSQQPAIIHYDLKPQNIIFSKGVLKVLDFGICKIIDSEHSKMALTSQGIGTYYYLPPQTFTFHNPVVSNKVDIWSLGIIFYEILFGKRPFSNCLVENNGQNNEIMNEIFKSNIIISEQCKNFILKCLQFDQSKRLDPLQILKDNYFLKKQ